MIRRSTRSVRERAVRLHDHVEETVRETRLVVDHVADDSPVGALGKAPKPWFLLESGAPPLPMMALRILSVNEAVCMPDDRRTGSTSFADRASALGRTRTQPKSCAIALALAPPTGWARRGVGPPASPALKFDERAAMVANPVRGDIFKTEKIHVVRATDGRFGKQAGGARRCFTDRRIDDTVARDEQVEDPLTRREDDAADVSLSCAATYSLDRARGDSEPQRV